MEYLPTTLRPRQWLAVFVACGMALVPCWTNAETGAHSDSLNVDFGRLPLGELHAAEPFACEPARKGAIAMTDLANLCSCNGSAWVTVGTQAHCVWTDGSGT